MTRTSLIGALTAASLGLVAATAMAADVVTRKDDKTIVKAPTTNVTVDETTGATRVKVRASDTRVDVDTDRGLVRIRVPYFNGDIRW
ncbi:MAG: hypothetical protein R3D67_08185 [Hyphomicrobiaceae bacterium]